MLFRSIAKKNIIVYDFDRTIYGGETGINFSTFYLKKYPLKSILFLIKYSKNLLFYLLKIINLTTLKERYFKFLETHHHSRKTSRIRVQPHTQKKTDGPPGPPAIDQEKHS